MSTSDSIRQQVSAAYAKAVSAPSGAGCCGGNETVPKGVVAKIAGYTREELAALPPEAVQNSFGCGNPLAFAGVREGQVVLDLGSGAGIDLLLAAKLVGPKGRVIGVDMTDEMIAKARQNIAQAGLSNVEVRKGIIEQLPVESGSVDWVISNCVINLSPDKPAVWKEIARVLKPGGQIAISDIVVKDLPASLREMPQIYNSCVGGAVSEEEYLAGLAGVGLTDVRVKDRLIYDRAMLRGFVESELKEFVTAPSCCGGSSLSSAWGDAVVGQVEGKVWSAKFAGRKV